jgi:TolB protein
MRPNRLRIIRSFVPLLAALVAAAAFLSASAAPQAQAAAPGALVFASYRNGLSAIDTINADGSGERQLTLPQRSFAGEPAYSPDGSKIAYVCGNFELCVMNADGTGQGRLTTSRWPQTWEYVDHPTWSPDGTKIAFASNADGNFHVYVINADGTGLHKLAGTALNDDDPSWSPDGTKIAFDNYKSWFSGTSAIYVMNADGSQPQRISPRGVDGWSPSWAPDGSEVVYSAWRDDDTHLFLVNADGTGNNQLTDGYCDEMDPNWMPSGLGLAFDRNCGGRLGIVGGHFGGAIDRITSPHHGFDLYPEWQPKTTGGSAATPIGPPSTPTGDARAASQWFYWSTQVWEIDYLPVDSASLERKTLADDLAAVAGLNATSPDTQRGKLLRSKAIAGFRLDAAASRKLLLYYRANAHKQRRLAKSYERAGMKLARRAEKSFNAADNLAELPY